MTTEQIKTAQQAMLKYIRENRAAIAQLIAAELREGTWDIEVCDSGVGALNVSDDVLDETVADALPLLGVSATIVLTIGGVSETINVECE